MADTDQDELTIKVKAILHDLGFIPGTKILERVDTLADEVLGAPRLSFDGFTVRDGGMKARLGDIEGKIDKIEERLEAGFKVRFGAKEWTAIILGIIGLLTNIIVTMGGTP